MVKTRREEIGLLFSLSLLFCFYCLYFCNREGYTHTFSFSFFFSVMFRLRPPELTAALGNRPMSQQLTYIKLTWVHAVISGCFSRGVGITLNYIGIPLDVFSA